MKQRKTAYKHIWILLLLGILLIATLTGCVPTEDGAIVERRAERLKELLEAKYGVEFEILHSRYTGTSERNSFGIRSEKYSYYSTASLYNEDTEKEFMIEAYGAEAFGIQSDKYIKNHMGDWFNERTFHLGAEILKKDQSVYDENTYDLDFYEFENVYENHEEIMGYGGVKVFYILGKDETVEEGLYEGFKNFMRWMQEWGAEEASVSFFVYDASAIDSEYYKRYIGQGASGDPYEAWELEKDLGANGYYVRGSGGGHRLNIEAALEMTPEEFQNEVVEVEAKNSSVILLNSGENKSE